MATPRKFSTARILGLCLGGLLLLALAVQGLEGLLPRPEPREIPRDPEVPESDVASSRPELVRVDETTILVHLGRWSRSRYHFEAGEDVDAVFACLQAGLDREYPEDSQGGDAGDDAPKSPPPDPGEVIQRLQDECVSSASRGSDAGDGSDPDRGRTSGG